MKYMSSKPLVCMQTQSTCYKGTTKITPVGILWHCTGANNPTLKRYVQPSDVRPKEDTYSKEEWLKILGKNKYGNDWNHITKQAGLNAWVGKLADGTVTSIQTMPWNFKPWGCGSGNKGSCNNGWIQFEICEDGLTDKTYFNNVYKEACELTAYLCKLYNIDPKGTHTYNGVKVPTILCHQDAYKLKVGSDHSDVYNWFKKHNKTMDNVRNDVASLMNVTPTPTTVRTYELYTDVPTYANAGDAKAKTNKKGTYKPGIYYIYNKYPDGVNGMLNISTDKTGNSAGSWINPSENKVEVKEEVQKIYRVRKSKDDAKTQKGAYSSLDNAKIACQEAGAGYHVFDWNFNIVYSYVAPVKPKEEPKVEPTPAPTPSVTNVYDLNFPIKTKIVDPDVVQTEGINEEDCTQAIVAIVKNNPNFKVEIAKAFFTLADEYHINPMMAISQSILETGWFKFAGSDAKAEQNNFCGLGVTGGGVNGASFKTIEEGVRAQLQHLYAYGCKDALPDGETTIVDPRFKYVTRGIAPYWQQLAGRWAVPGYDKATYSTPEAAMKAENTYGQKILKICTQLENTKITEADIKKYFVEDIKPTPVDPKPDDDKKEIDTDKVNTVLALLEKLLNMVLSWFSKK